ncbi:MAG: peptidoglycan DD-metalloendopeptidase family protein [Pseudomonadota bacterium]
MCTHSRNARLPAFVLILIKVFFLSPVWAAPNSFLETAIDTTLDTKQIASEDVALKVDAIQEILLLAREIERSPNKIANAEQSDSEAESYRHYVLRKLSNRLNALLRDLDGMQPLGQGMIAITADEVKKSPTPETLLANIQAQKFSSEEKKFQWPVDGKDFSAPGQPLRPGGANWPGILITSSPGASVRAISSGVVVYAGEMKHLGQLVIVDHEDGHLSLYGKNAEIVVRQQQKITENQVIGSLDDSSNSSLYFEVRRNGVSLDPREVCVDSLSR